MSRSPFKVPLSRGLSISLTCSIWLCTRPPKCRVRVIADANRFTPTTPMQASSAPAATSKWFKLTLGVFLALLLVSAATATVVLLATDSATNELATGVDLDELQDHATIKLTNRLGPLERVEEDATRLPSALRLKWAEQDLTDGSKALDNILSACYPPSQYPAGGYGFWP